LGGEKKEQREKSIGVRIARQRHQGGEKSGRIGGGYFIRGLGVSYLGEILGVWTSFPCLSCMVRNLGWKVLLEGIGGDE